jgi:hypothetical protein
VGTVLFSSPEAGVKPLISQTSRLIVLAIVLYVFHIVLGMLLLPPQIRTLILLLIGLVVLLALLDRLGLFRFGLLMVATT